MKKILISLIIISGITLAAFTISAKQETENSINSQQSKSPEELKIIYNHQSKSDHLFDLDSEV